jgi:hypothetical protein
VVSAERIELKPPVIVQNSEVTPQPVMDKPRVKGYSCGASVGIRSLKEQLVGASAVMLVEGENADASSYPVTAQVLVGGVWTAFWSGTADPGKYSHLVNVPAEYSSGTITVRAVIPASGSCGEGTSENFDISFIASQHIYGGFVGVTDIVQIQNGDTLPATGKFNIGTYVTSSPVGVGQGAIATAWTLQRSLDANTWTDLSAKVKLSSTTYGMLLTATVPALSKSKNHAGATVYYRLVPGPSADTESNPTEVWKVKYFNLKAALKSAVKKGAKGVTIKYASLGSGTIGAHPLGTKVVYFDYTKLNAMTKKSAVQAAIHETGHVMQTRAYKIVASSYNKKGGKLGRTAYTRYQLLLKDANRYFKVSKSSVPALEHMADCYAQNITKVVSATVSVGYGGKCTKKQLNMVKRLKKGKRIV